VSPFYGLRCPAVSARARAAVERHGGCVGRVRGRGPRAWVVLVPVTCKGWSEDTVGILRATLPGGAGLACVPGAGVVHARDLAAGVGLAS